MKKGKDSSTRECAKKSQPQRDQTKKLGALPKKKRKITLEFGNQGGK